MVLVRAILAVLAEEPCSGYDLRKRFEGSVGFFWKVSFQQIYRELTQLEVFFGVLKLQHGELMLLRN